MSDDNLNILRGQRLKEVRKEKGLTQSDLAELSNYSVQQISYVECGKRGMSLESARIFAKKLNIYEDYLLCESDIKSEKEYFSKRGYLFDERSKLINALIEHTGYELISEFISNFSELKIPPVDPGILNDYNRHYEHIPFDAEDKARFGIEIKTPLGKIITCDPVDIELLEYEILDFIKLRFRQLESKFDWEYDEAYSRIKLPGSETRKFQPHNASEILDYTYSGIWADTDPYSHDDDI